MQHTILETFIKNFLQNLISFHGEILELEILEIFKTPFLLWNIIWT